MTDQERKEWLLWRHSAITASDAACLYGANPYKKLEVLYAEKIQDSPTDSIPNIAMRRGVELEPILRAKAEAEHLQTYKATNAEHPKYSFIRASLDGLTEDGTTVLEVKYVGAKVFGIGTVPKHYWIQVQHQMLASGAVYGFVIMGMDENNYKIIPVERDEAFINQHIILCEQFWMNVQARKSPPSSVVEVIDSKAIALADEYKKLKAVSDEIATELENVRAELLQFVNSDEARVNGLHIKKILTKGNVDYSRIDALKNIDLEQFRKESRVSYKISID